VKVNGLEMGQGVRSWEEQVEISRDVFSMSDDQVLDLNLAGGCYKQHKSGSTVRTVLEEAAKEARGKYVPDLQAEIGEGNVHCWALVRVGLARIVCANVFPPPAKQQEHA
jgi:hypothetical protein